MKVALATGRPVEEVRAWEPALLATVIEELESHGQ